MTNPCAAGDIRTAIKKHVSILSKTYRNCFNLPILKGHGTEPAVQCGEEMRDNLLIWAAQRSCDFHIKVVAEAYIQHSGAVN